MFQNEHLCETIVWRKLAKWYFAVFSVFKPSQTISVCGQGQILKGGERGVRLGPPYESFALSSCIVFFLSS